MIPTIFISSTVEDLQHLRDGIRDTVAELGYTPIMSEYGDIGYLPNASAEESCYISLTDCHLAVLIVGKRYGSISKTGHSVTENEFRTAKENGLPIITLIDQEVMSFKRVYDAHPADDKPKNFPGMEAPKQTFQLIQGIMDSSSNNGILPFSNVAEARAHMKRQLAHLFGELLRNQYNALTTTVKDVLSEIKTLRHEISGGNPPDSRFLMAIRFLVDESNDQFRKLLEHTSGPIDAAVPIAYDADDIVDFMKRVGFTVKVVEPPADTDQDGWFFKLHNIDMTYGSAFALKHPTPEDKMVLGHWATTRTRDVMITQPTLNYFQESYSALRKVIEGAQQKP